MCYDLGLLRRFEVILLRSGCNNNHCFCTWESFLVSHWPLARTTDPSRGRHRRAPPYIYDGYSYYTTPSAAAPLGASTSTEDRRDDRLLTFSFVSRTYA